MRAARDECCTHQTRLVCTGRPSCYIFVMATPSQPARALHERDVDEAEEDRLDAEELRDALAKFKASGEKSIPLDDVLADHGLTRADLSG